MEGPKPSDSTGVQEPDDPVQDAQAETARSMRELFSEFTKTARIFRTYPRDNSMSINSVDKLASTFSTCLDRWGEIELFVERDHLIFGSETVLQDDNPRRSIPIKLDRAGVRRLVFLPGMERQEVLNLLDALTTELDEESIEDDVVTLMWQKQFTHVKTFVLDDLSEDERFDESKVGRSDPEPVEEETQAGPEERWVPTEEQRRLDAENTGKLAEECSRTKSKLPPPTPEELESLRTEVELQENCDVSGELADVLFEVVATSREDASSSNMRNVLGQLVVMRMRAADFVGATKLLTQIEKLARKPGLDSEQAQHLKELLGKIFTEEHVEELKDILIANPEAGLEGLEALTAYFPTESLGKLTGLLSLERGQSDIDRILRQVFTGRAGLLTPALANTDIKLRNRVMKLVEALATEESVGALGAMVTALEGEERLKLVQVIARFRCDSAKVVLSELMADANADVRRVAIKALGTFDGAMDTTQVRLLISDKTFDERPLGEKKGLFNVLAHAEGTGAVDLLKAIAQNKGWFESEKHLETRACAVLALGETTSEVARAVLARYAQDKAESIRAAAHIALRRIERELVTVG